LIRFASGQEIDVSGNSQVVIERSPDGSTDAIVSLVKGRVDTRVSEPSRLTLAKRRIVVKAGTQRVLVHTSEDRATVSRSPGAATPAVKADAGAPIQQDIRSGQMRTLVAVTPSPVPTDLAEVAADMPSQREPIVDAAETVLAVPAAPAEPAPVAAATPNPPSPAPPQRRPPVVPKPPPRARVFKAPRIVTPAMDVTYWTPRPLPSADPYRLPIVLSSLPKGAPGRPAIEIYRQNAEPQTVIASPRGASRHLVAMVDLKRPESLVLKPTIAAGASAKIKVTPSKQMRLHIRSLASAPHDQAVAVSLERLAEKSGDGVIAEPPDFDPNQAPVKLHLAKGVDLPKVASFLRGSGGFAIHPARQPAPRNGFHIVRDGKIAASLTGEVEPGDVLSLTERLGGSLAFAGKVEHYRESLPNVRATGDVVLLTDDGVRVDLHRALLRRQATARSIASAHGAHYFVGPPELILPEPKHRPLPTDAPALGSWSNPGDMPAYPRRLVFIESVFKAKAPTYMQLDAGAFNARGLFEAVNGTEALLSYQINNFPKVLSTGATDASAQPAASLVSYLLQLARADAVVFAPPTGSWTVATVENGRALILGGGPPPGKRKDHAEVHDWLRRVLAFDGVVLERRGDYALAACSSDKGLPHRQGIVPATPAIIEVVEAADGRCLLRTLLGGSTPAGARVVFE
jgi:hypothetical protein